MGGKRCAENAATVMIIYFKRMLHAPPYNIRKPKGKERVERESEKGINANNA